jgi:hypothetical protein
MFSHVQGDEEAILRSQTSSARYFQRPDAGHVEVDSSLTSLSGWGGTVKLGKRGNGRINFESSLSMRSPGFEINNIGYMRYADIIHHGTWMGYYIREPFSIFRNLYINLNYWMYGNFDGKLLQFNQNINFNTQFKNYWYLNGSLSRYRESISTTRLRGGPAFIEPGAWSFNFNVSSDRRKKFYFNFGHWFQNGDFSSSFARSYWFGFTYRPFNSMTFSMYPSFDENRDKLQYIGSETLDDEIRYLFAEIDQGTVGITFRLNLNITPDLSIQYYGQPFVSAGKYNHLKRITDPQADSFENRYHTFTGDEVNYDPDNNMYDIDENRDGTVDYSIDNPDFNFRQFRSNLVVRWEYKPGSTLYLVWSQGRTSYVNEGAFSYGNDIRDLFQVYPHDVFLLKMNYWFSF